MSRITITVAQARLLFGEQSRPPRFQAKSGPRIKRNKADLPENQVEEACLAFLRAKGWSIIRQHVGVYLPYFAVKQLQNSRREPGGLMVRIGTKGQCDWRCERPIRRGTGAGAFECFELETKAPGQKPSAHQEQYMRDRNALGFVAVWFDSVDKLRVWHQERFGEC